MADNTIIYVVLVENSQLVSWKITEDHLTKSNIDSVYKDKNGWNIYEDMLGKIEIDKIEPVVSAGCACLLCKEWFQWAEANQSDGRFACWVCRHDPRNMLEV